MPFGKDPLQYPQEFWDLTKDVSDGETAVIELETRQKANSLRTRLYAFWRALDFASQQKPRVGMEPSEYQRILEFAKKGKSIQALANGHQLVVRPRDADPVVEAIAKRKRSTSKIVVKEEKVDESLARLQEKLSGKS